MGDMASVNIQHGMLAQELPAAQYHAIPALSNSGMKDLMVSPLRYWHLHVNPERTERKETPEMALGTALHCAVLEATAFDARYACEVDESDFADCLDTMDDLRSWLRDKGITPKGTRKAEVVQQVVAAGCDLPILEVELAAFAEATQGKAVLSKCDFARVTGMRDALMAEPQMQSLLSTGNPEVSLFQVDPDTGVPLKARMDWCRTGLTLDLKTFSQSRGRSIDRSVADAIFYEAYYRQAAFYHRIRGGGRFVFAFVESDPPHEVRIKALEPGHIYWNRAQIEISSLIDTYAEYRGRFGERPWRDQRAIETLADEDIPALAY